MKVWLAHHGGGALAREVLTRLEEHDVVSAPDGAELGVFLPPGPPGGHTYPGFLAELPFPTLLVLPDFLGEVRVSAYCAFDGVATDRFTRLRNGVPWAHWRPEDPLPGRAFRRDWWPLQVLRSQARLDLPAALEVARSPLLRACLLATMADFEPELRPRAIRLFERLRSRGCLVDLSLAYCWLREGRSDEAVTVLCEAVRDGVPYRPGPFYPMLPNRFLRRWHAFPRRRERLVRARLWTELARQVPAFAHWFARQAIRWEPQEAEGWWQWALRLGHRPKLQARVLREVLKREPMRLEARVALIRVLWLNARFRVARREYARAQELFPDDPGLARFWKDLRPFS